MKKMYPNKGGATETLLGRLCGDSLRLLIKQRGVTRYRLAKETNISYRTIQYWEAGKRPSVKLALVVGRYLGLTEEIDKAEIKKQLDELQEKLRRYGY